MVKHLLKAKVRQGIGKVRRYALSRFGKEYIEKQLKARQGDCIRCGTCCKLLFHCPFLEERKDGSTSCKIHHKRPRNCRIFPINNSDIRDRNSKRPDTPCGFSFPDDHKSSRKSCRFHKGQKK